MSQQPKKTNKAARIFCIVFAILMVATSVAIIVSAIVSSCNTPVA